MEEVLSRMLSSVKYKFDSIGASIIRILTKFTKDTATRGVLTDNIAQDSSDRLLLDLVSHWSDRYLRELL